jgi:F-type H+-transporting ATPase subunit gamma
VASLKELKLRINSVKSTQKITKAKQMVAAAKLRKAQAAAEAARPYAGRLADVMASLASKVQVGEGSPKLLAGTGKDQVHPGRRQFRSRPVRRVQCQHRQGRQGQGAGIDRPGQDGEVLPRRPQGPRPDPPRFPNAIAGGFDTTTVREAGFAEAEKIANELLAMYEAGKFDVAHLFFSRFRSALRRSPPRSRSFPCRPRRPPWSTMAVPWSITNPTRKRSWPICCRATCASSSSARCSKTWPANRAPR